MKPFPLTFRTEESINVNNLTNEYLENNQEIQDRLYDILWAYNSIGKMIPHTMENYWSGHFFPYSDSWEEMQVSYNLCSFGFYKQAFVSLRSVLELGLLSVYYNINDDGHITVKDWLKSKDSWDANTPRAEKIWKILRSNKNISNFDNAVGLKVRFDNLSYLHNYVHTKGYKYSNSVGLIKKSNQQTFEKEAFEKWINSLEEIIILIITTHLLKYPISIIKFDWTSKFGIDVPGFGGMQGFEIERIEKIIPSNYLEEINHIALQDENTQILFKEIESMPDLSDEEQEEKIIELEKLFIINGEGFIKWKERQLELLDRFKGQMDESIMKKRISIIEDWAKKNDMMEPNLERLKKQGIFLK